MKRVGKVKIVLWMQDKHLDEALILIRNRFELLENVKFVHHVVNPCTPCPAHKRRMFLPATPGAEVSTTDHFRAPDYELLSFNHLPGLATRARPENLLRPTTGLKEGEPEDCLNLLLLWNFLNICFKPVLDLTAVVLKFGTDLPKEPLIHIRIHIYQ